MADRLGDAEVEQARSPIRSHEDVRGLEVEVHEAVGMEGLDRVGDLDQQECDMPRGERGRRFRIPVERLTLDVLERDERVAQRLVNAEHRDDRRMVERLEPSRLRQEMATRLGVLRVAEDLQRDGAIARFVVRAPDVGGAAGADVRREPVATGHDGADLAAVARQDLGDIRALHRSA